MAAGTRTQELPPIPPHADYEPDIVDALIPWVDSNDPGWQEKYIHYKAAESNRGYFRNATTATRFENSGELNRCLRSIAKNAPWFRKIFILSDNQTPHLGDIPVEARSKIEVVSHEHIFRCHPHVLPTFNSIAFDCLVWNIDEMAERFVYFNDDHFVTRPVTPSDFYDGERIIVRGKWSPMRRSLISRIRRRLTGLPSGRPDLPMVSAEQRRDLGSRQDISNSTILPGEY